MFIWIFGGLWIWRHTQMMWCDVIWFNMILHDCTVVKCSPSEAVSLKHAHMFPLNSSPAPSETHQNQQAVSWEDSFWRWQLCDQNLSKTFETTSLITILDHYISWMAKKLPNWKKKKKNCLKTSLVFLNSRAPDSLVVDCSSRDVSW